jgi:hypothetical protein
VRDVGGRAERPRHRHGDGRQVDGGERGGGGSHGGDGAAELQVLCRRRRRRPLEGLHHLAAQVA